MYDETKLQEQCAQIHSYLAQSLQGKIAADNILIQPSFAIPVDTIGSLPPSSATDEDGYAPDSLLISSSKQLLLMFDNPEDVSVTAHYLQESVGLTVVPMVWEYDVNTENLKHWSGHSLSIDTAEPGFASGMEKIAGWLKEQDKQSGKPTPGTNAAADESNRWQTQMRTPSPAALAARR